MWSFGDQADRGCISIHASTVPGGERGCANCSVGLTHPVGNHMCLYAYMSLANINNTAAFNF